MMKLMDRFWQWEREYQPDCLTEAVLWSLLEKYEKGYAACVCYSLGAKFRP